MTGSLTGERVVTADGGFNPTWQRHVAAYALCGPLLGSGEVVDVGCGIGHSYGLLAPRESVGVDIEPAALEGQQRATVVADMRSMPFVDAAFDSALSVHSIEHVPDPERALEEMARVIQPEGCAIVVTPNRLTFARPDEIIDPYHYIEFDPGELERVCLRAFHTVRMAGIFGSARYQAIVAREKAKLDALLRIDPLRLRRLVPRSARQRLYDWRLSRERADQSGDVLDIAVDDFSLGWTELEHALDVVAICREPVRAR